MDIKGILEQLKKEKDKIKYLEKELKKINDKKLKGEIEKLIEKLKSDDKKKPAEEKIKIPSLEQIASSIPRARMQPVQTERIENYQSRSRARVIVPEGAGAVAQQKMARQQGYNDNYGSNIKSDYIMTKADFNRQLETSGLMTRSGFTTTAESKHAIQQKAGDKREYMDDRDNLNIHQYNTRDEMIKENMIGLSSDLKQAKRGRREIEVYHG